MPQPISRRTVLKTAAATALTLPLVRLGQAQAAGPGWVCGKMTGAAALVEALKTEGVDCVFGIPGSAGERAVGRDEESTISATCSSRMNSRPRAWPMATPAPRAGRASCASCPDPA